MNADKILFPTDFSPCSQLALEDATSIALETGAVMLITHVHQPTDFVVDPGFGCCSIHEDGAGLNQLLERVRPTDSTVCFEHRLLCGNPAYEIPRLANDEHVDMIVMGARGRTGLSRLLMGSVVESVIRHAHCPVLTVKNQQKEEAGVKQG